ncbi:MAG: hypothetical protein ACR2GX_03355 [Candidatus Dormibacteria bacterium]
MRSVGVAGALLLLALAACGSAKSDPSPTVTPTGRNQPTVTALPSGTGSPGAGVLPVVHVDASGASVSNEGMVGVAVITNPAADAAAHSITVTFTVTSKNGQAPVTGTAPLGALEPGESAAVTAVLPVPGNDEVAGVTATAAAASAAAKGSPEQVRAGGARFSTDAHSAAVDATLTNAAAVVPVVAVAVCYDSSGTIIGGGELAVSAVAAGSTPVHIVVSVADTPASVKVFVHPPV